MGSPATGTALILLVAFVLPGFVTVLLQERTFKSADDLTPFDRLLRAVYYSVWCYLLLAAVALILGLDRRWAQSFVDRHDDNPAGLAWLAALLILGPAAIVWYSTLRFQSSRAKAKLLGWLNINERHQQPTGWDFWFAKGFKTHVRIVYPDESIIWGYYGADSFASYAKDGLNLYLEAIYRAQLVVESETSNDVPGLWFGKPHANSCGGWVKVDEAVLVELYDFSNGDQSADAAAADAGSTSSSETPSAAGSTPSPATSP